MRHPLQALAMTNPLQWRTSNPPMGETRAHDMTYTPSSISTTKPEADTLAIRNESDSCPCLVSHKCSHESQPFLLILILTDLFNIRPNDLFFPLERAQRAPWTTFIDSH